MFQSLFAVFTPVIALLSLATAIGIAFAVLVPPHRTRMNIYFAGFALILGVYSGLLINPNPILPDILRTQLLLTSFVLLPVAFFHFVTAFLETATTVQRHFWAVTGVVLSVLLLVLWQGASNSPIHANPHTLGAYIIKWVATIYAFGAFGMVCCNQKQQAHWLRIPTFFVAMGCLLHMTLHVYQLEMIGFTIAAIWAAWRISWLQIFSPMQQMNIDLQHANAQLYDALYQLETQKDELAHLNLELRRANHYKNEFMTNVTHELRTPLNAIIGYGELLNSPIYGELNERQHNRVKRIQVNAQRLLQIVNAILDFTKLDSGTAQLDYGDIRLHALIERVAMDCRPYADDKALALHVTGDATIHLKVDKFRIEQLLYQLIDNAIKFTHEGEIKVHTQMFTVCDKLTKEITLPTHVDIADGAWALITIKDTGVGISPEQQAEIFVNFRQGDGSLTRNYGGLGLGLSLSKRIVTLHHGTIWLDSQVGQGTTFYVALPYVREKILLT